MEKGGRPHFTKIGNQQFVDLLYLLSQWRSVSKEGSLRGEITQRTRTARDKSQENTAPPLFLRGYPLKLPLCPLLTPDPSPWQDHISHPERGKSIHLHDTFDMIIKSILPWPHCGSSRTSRSAAPRWPASGDSRSRPFQIVILSLSLMPFSRCI